MKKEKLYNNKWFNVINVTDKDNANMIGLELIGVGNVVILPYVLNNNDDITQIGLMYERNPLWGEGEHPTTISGGIEKGEIALDAAIRELKEESGYSADKNRFTYLGEFHSSKLITNKQPCFAVDITDLKPETADKDGTVNEELSYFKLLTTKDALTESKDFYTASLFAKLLIKLS